MTTKPSVVTSNLPTSNATSSSASAINTTSHTLSPSNKQVADEAWKRAEKINGELFALTYGSLVAQLLRDLEDGSAVNDQLDRMGYGMGIRIADELVARTSGAVQCHDFERDTPDILRLLFRLFFNTTPGVSLLSSGDAGKKSDLSILINMPLAEGADGLGSEWVELPEIAIKDLLHFANLLAGLIRGLLEMFGQSVECEISKDPLLTSTITSTEIRVKFLSYISETLPPSD